MNRTVTRIVIALLALTGVVRYVRERAIVRDALDTIARDRAELMASAPPRPKRKTDGFSLIICAFLLGCVVYVAQAAITWLGSR